MQRVDGRFVHKIVKIQKVVKITFYFQVHRNVYFIKTIHARRLFLL